MDRSIERLAANEFELVIVGGGIYGACLAWEAVSRGLSVALVEQTDFGWATSANIQRILHGGFRYLRNIDVKRIRESVRERNTMMRLAPHLTDTMPFLVPTYRWGVQQRGVMRMALKLYDLLAYDRNRGISDHAKQISPGRIVSREECLRLAPGLDPKGVTGGAVWQDACIHNPARLTLEFVRSATEQGACAANYVQVNGFLRKGTRINGVTATDLLTGNRLDIRARLVVNTCGPWINQLLAKLGKDALHDGMRFVRSIDIVTRPLTCDNHGLAVMAEQVGAPGHMMRYFVAPWRGLSVVGSVDYLEDTDPDRFGAEESELEYLVRAVGSTLPGAALSTNDILCVQAGLIPHADTEPLDDPYNAARHYQIIDHSKRTGVEGLVSVSGIKYTTARDIAQKTVDFVLKKLDKRPIESRTAVTPLHGGGIKQFGGFLKDTIRRRPLGLEPTVVERLIRNHGSAYSEVLSHIRERRNWKEPIAPDSPVIKAQVVHAIRTEMAQKLADVVFRRTTLGVRGHPGATVLRACADVMAPLLGWDPRRVERELEETEAYLARFWARPAQDSDLWDSRLTA